MDYQPASQDTIEKKYLLRDHQNRPVEDIPGLHFRVAKALAGQETEDKKDYWEERFLWALENGAVPGGRIIANAGAQDYKPATSLINCTMSGTILDDMDSILSLVREAGLTLKAGCGIGYDWSCLRPSGAFVGGAGAYTSGPISFMHIYDSMCRTISSAGDRRGAQMATMDIRHPDIEAYIRAKREPGVLTQFNLSVLFTQDFMQAVEEDKDWNLIFPVHSGEWWDQEYLGTCAVDRDPPPPIEYDWVWAHWPGTEDHPHKNRNGGGTVPCKIYRMIRARDLWQTVMQSAYDFAEPGFMLVDRLNDQNNLWWLEEIRGTNPCGEQPLPPYGACLLGSILLTMFVDNPFTDKATFNFEGFKEVVRVFTRMLDNVVDISGLPLEKQREEILAKRRHGMGFMGLGSALAMMGVPYGSEKAQAFTEEVAKTMAITGWEVGVELAKEKGVAPVLDQEYEITAEIRHRLKDYLGGDLRIGDKVNGSLLLAYGSRYLAQFPKELRAAIENHGSRFTHHTSIAPTGTISLGFGNNCSNGIEPTFAQRYGRNITQPDGSKKKVKVYSAELMAYAIYMTRSRGDAVYEPDDLLDYPNEVGNKLPKGFVDTATITPEQHLRMQAAAQKWVDSSISKTINVPEDFPFEDFKGAYLLAHQLGLKGCTMYRPNPDRGEAILVREEETPAIIVFETEAGPVEVPRNQMIDYQGEQVLAQELWQRLRQETQTT